MIMDEDFGRYGIQQDNNSGERFDLILIGVSKSVL